MSSARSFAGRLTMTEPTRLQRRRQAESGTVQLRGLDVACTMYKVKDYVNKKDLGTVPGPVGTLDANFDRLLALEAEVGAVN